MAVSVKLGKKPYCLIWRLCVTDANRHYESNAFSLEDSRWCFVLQIEVNSHHSEEDWKMYLRKLTPAEGYHTFLITINMEDKKKRLECLNFSRVTVTKPGTEQILWRRKSNVILKYPDISLEGNVAFVITLLTEHRHMSQLENYTDSKHAQTPPYMDIHPCLETLTTDFRKLLVDGPETDVELRCGERTLHAHKAVLIARSEVFAAMLQNDMLEKSKGAIDIIDIDFPTLELFLKYLYGGTVPELTAELAPKLYVASDKYAVRTLMTRCSDFLREHLSEANACSLLVLADTHNDKDLKEFVTSYIIRKDILSNLYEGNAFRDCYPKLAVDVLYRAYKISKCSLK